MSLRLCPPRRMKQKNMIEKTTLKFLTDLKKNNVKEWFDANRKRYEGGEGKCI